MWVLENFEKLPKYNQIDGKWKIDFKELPVLGASPDAIITKKDSYFDEDPDSLLLELKCPTPFIQNFKKKGQMNSSKYKYFKRKPHKKIPVYYIPQIQAQMMITQTKKLLFGSWTTTNGMNIFEVDYDEKYCAMMVKFIRDFYQEFVITNREPSENIFFDQEDYKIFLDKTLEISSNAKLVKEIKVVANSKNEPDMWLK